MGLDYSYLLYFPRSRLWDVLDGLASFADATGECRIDLPGSIMQLPFEAWAGTPAHLRWDRLEPELNFMTSLKFDPDALLEEYSACQGVDPPPGAPIPVGYIYLTICSDLSGHESGETDPNLVRFQLMAATTRMSILMAESPSIRRTFSRLLAACKGVCGLIDREESAELIWWRGSERSVELPEADLTLAEIAAHLDGND